MNTVKSWICGAFTFVVSSGLALAVESVQTAQPIGDFKLRQALHLPVANPAHSDCIAKEIELMLVDQRLGMPAPGEVVDCGSGMESNWSEVTLEGRDYEFSTTPGSWLYFSVEDLPAGPGLIDLNGYSKFYVNGLPRPAKPHSSGTLAYPIELQDGVNEILVQASSEKVYVRVRPHDQEKPLFEFSHYDKKLPWLVHLEPVDVVASMLISHQGMEPVSDLRIATKTRFEPLNHWADYPDDAVPGEWEYTDVEYMPANSVVSVPYRLAGPPPHKRSGIPYTVDLELQRASDGEVLASYVMNVSSRNIGDHFLRTWVDDLGTVQQCVILAPEWTLGDGPNNEHEVLVAMPTLLKSGIIDVSYAFEKERETEELILVPNTRRLGLAQSGLGRNNVIEALELARSLHGINEDRVAINGFADAGIDAWDLAMNRPGVFSGVGCIGIDMPQLEEMPMIGNVSDVDLMYRHGQFDPTIKSGVSHVDGFRQSASGRTTLEIVPEKERWWGAGTISDSTMLDYLLREGDGRPDINTIDVIQDECVTAHPEHWAIIHQRLSYEHPARLRASMVDGQAVISTENVRQVLLRNKALQFKDSVVINIDDELLSVDSASGELCLVRNDDGWEVAEACEVNGKTRLRSGHDHLFSRPLLLVYGTAGDDESDRELWGHARFDSEFFWSKADGPGRVVADTAVTDEMLEGMNVVLYGNEDTNKVWNTYLPDAPIKIGTGELLIGDEVRTGEDLAVFFLQPLPGDPKGLVGAIGSSGDVGRRLAQHVFVTDPMVQLPDWLIMDRASFKSGMHKSGSFDRNWTLATQP
ncbi:MAG: hypothetical protein CMJ39_12005 [Phycisphaerae bacterium]|nr:hypothetical protein [Phycisphaerae bacterium]